MNIYEQIKVLFFSFIYGMFLMSSLSIYKKLKINKRIIKFLSELLFCLSSMFIFYYLLYKINNGVLSIYIFIMLFLGVFFCKVLYFNNRNT